MLTIFMLLIAFVGSAASAQVCRPELNAVLADSADSAVVTGLDAARALKRAVTLVEPALPALVTIDRLPLPLDHPDASTVRYLAERRLLPAGWVPEHLTPTVWHEMQRRLLGWYALDAPLPPVSVPTDDAALVDEFANLLKRIADAIRPAALFAVQPDDPLQLAFLAVIWNWSVYPRLLVFRPESEETFGGQNETPLASLETCVRRMQHWFSAPAPTARKLFLANHRARMVVVGSEPAKEGQWPWWVPEGEELAVFDFTHPRVADLRAYSVVFDGPSVGVAGLVRLLPSVRTNISPLELRRYLQTPQ